MQSTSVHKMARGRKKKQRAPKGRVEDDSANDTIQAEDSFNRDFSENTRGVSTAVVSTDRQDSEQVLSAAPNLIQTEGIIASGTLGQGATYTVRMREDYVPSPTPGPSTGQFAYNQVSSTYDVNRELFGNPLPIVSEPTFSVAPPLRQGRPNFSLGSSITRPEMITFRSGVATRSMAARSFVPNEPPQQPRAKGHLHPSVHQQGEMLNPIRRQNISVSQTPPIVTSNPSLPGYAQSTVPVCVNGQSTTAHTMAHPGVIPASSTQPVRSQQQQYVSSQVFVTAPSANPSIFSTRMSTVANVGSSNYVGTSVAPALVVVSQPPNYSMPVFHTYRVPTSSPNPDQMQSFYHSTVTPHRIHAPHAPTLGIGPVPGAPSMMQPGMQAHGMSYPTHSLPQSISQPHVYGMPPAFANKQTYHHLKGKDMEVPKYKGFNDTRTPYDYIVELEKFQSILGYTDHDMLFRVIPMSLYGEAYTWFRSEMIPFSSLYEFKERLRREYQAVGYSEDLMREIDKRTQGPNEPLTSYIRVMRDYYDRLGDPYVTEHDILRRILRNMHPEYRQAIQGKPIANLFELQQAAYGAQELIKSYRTYRPPPVTGSLEPSLACSTYGRDSTAEYSAHAVVDYNKPPPRLQYASFDPFTYYHQPIKKEVTFRTPISSAPSSSATPGAQSGTVGLLPRTQSSGVSNNARPLPGSTPPPQRSRSPSPSSSRLCFICNNSDHWARECPLKPPNRGNSRSPSPLLK